ncbi:WD40 repeat protein [Kribbella rubisoli]|uniref:WD40 repeat protein n=1 Tax=Kribbella rubisoli TaxID=3075929 RepID=A0A4Q7WZH9_9ACTN|nr:hypothetical protein [Kribbella rubisoli]RZU15992.1 WD40 repeat protein [Kribbella rubisoli]
MTGDGPRVEIFGIGIGAYTDPAHLPLSVDQELQAISQVLADFGAVENPWTAPDFRGSDAVFERLRAWRQSPEPRTFLCWIGHGITDQDRAALLHSMSEKDRWAGCFTPENLVEFIVEKDLGATDHEWSVVVIDACGSSTFVKELGALVDKRSDERRMLLIGTSGDGASRLGRFSHVLRTVLADTFAANQSITLWDLCGELRSELPDAEVVPKNIRNFALVRRTPVVSGMTIDHAAEVQAVLARLNDDERRHFAAKAQGGELGDESWYYQERAAETAHVVDWLSATRSGLLVITGPPGSGKSALLGQLVVRTRPEIRSVLERLGLLIQTAEGDRPPDDIFDLSLHLTGMTTADLLAQIAGLLDLVPPPAQLPHQVEWLIARLSGHAGAPLTVLLDALDEAADPVAMAASLRRLSRLPAVRLVVGTRQVAAGEDNAVDVDLLAILQVRPSDVVTVQRDGDAIAGYARRRLTDAVRAGELIADPDLIARTSARIGGGSDDFLGARLIIAELRATPGPLTEDGITPLLQKDHRTLFADAVARMQRHHSSARTLLRALAMARGRGLPLRDGVWAQVGSALSAGQLPNGDDIHDLLRIAAPYVSVHHEHGQTVYRLAHRTFEEHFEADRTEVAEGHAKIVRVLADSLRARGASNDTANPYIAHYVSAHALAGGGAGWEQLAEMVDVFDRLELPALVGDALRSGKGSTAVPPEISAVISVWHVLASAAPEDRKGILQLALARQCGESPPLSAMNGAWSLERAVMVWQAAHLVLPIHTKGVNAVVPVVRGGRTLVASAGSDGRVRIWDTLAQPREVVTWSGPRSAATALAVLSGAGQSSLVVGRQDGTVSVWDPWAGQDRVRRLSCHEATVTALSVLEQAGKLIFASGDISGRVLVQDVRTGDTLSTWQHPRGSSVQTLTSSDGKGLHIGCNDGSLRRWEPLSEAAPGSPVQAHRGGIRAAVAKASGGTRASEQAWILSAGNDGEVKEWTAFTATPEGGQARIRQDYGVRALASWNDGATSYIATGNNKGIVALWSADAGVEPTASLSTNAGRIRDIAVLTADSSRQVLALAGEDGAVRIWDAMSARPASDSNLPISGLARLGGELPMLAVCTASGVEFISAAPHRPDGDLPAPVRAPGITAVDGYLDSGGRPVLVLGSNSRTAVELRSDRKLRVVRVHGRALTSFAGGDHQTVIAGATDDGAVWLWDAETLAVSRRIKDDSGPIHTLISYVGADSRARLVTAGRTVRPRIWDPATGESSILDLPQGAGKSAMALIPAQSRLLLAAAGNDRTVHLWDLELGTPVLRPLVHRSPVRAIGPAESSDGGVVMATACADGTIGLWNPLSGEVGRIISGFPIACLAGLAPQTIALGGADGLAIIRYEPGQLKTDNSGTVSMANWSTDSA